LNNAIRAIERLKEALNSRDERRSRVEDILNRLKQMKPPAQEKKKRSKARG